LGWGGGGGGGLDIKKDLEAEYLSVFIGTATWNLQSGGSFTGDSDRHVKEDFGSEASLSLSWFCERNAEEWLQNEVSGRHVLEVSGIGVLFILGLNNGHINTMLILTSAVVFNEGSSVPLDAAS